MLLRVSIAPGPTEENATKDEHPHASTSKPEPNEPLVSTESGQAEAEVKTSSTARAKAPRGRKSRVAIDDALGLPEVSIPAVSISRSSRNATKPTSTYAESSGSEGAGLDSEEEEAQPKRKRAAPKKQPSQPRRQKRGRASTGTDEVNSNNKGKKTHVTAVKASLSRSVSMPNLKNGKPAGNKSQLASTSSLSSAEGSASVSTSPSKPKVKLEDPAAGPWSDCFDKLVWVFVPAKSFDAPSRNLEEQSTAPGFWWPAEVRIALQRTLNRC